MSKPSILTFTLACLFLASCDKTPSYNPFIIVDCDEVLEYLPAPGQFIDSEARTMEEACEYAYGRLQERHHVSLGAFGGYITAKLKENITNGFIVIVNNSTNSSSEPGIVYLQIGGEWVEAEGTLHGTEEETHGYSVTYFKPEEGEDVRWTDNLGGEGTIVRNEYHSDAPYYPTWVSEDSYTLSGIMLKSRAYDKSDNGTMWINPTYGEGYADNYANEYPEFRERVNKAFGSAIIPANANIIPVRWPVSAVKIQSAVMGQCGWIGEISTEVCGIFGIQCNNLE